MREIKFRVWDGAEMHYPEIITFDSTNVSFAPANLGGGTFSLPIAAAMQFTGLRDKNGKEIYEGDIISLWYEEMFFQDTVTGIVEYDETRACFQIVFDTTAVTLSFRGLDIECSEIEVIGNIYQDEVKTQ